MCKKSQLHLQCLIDNVPLRFQYGWVLFSQTLLWHILPLYTLHSQNDILKNIEEIKNSGRLLNPIAWQNKNSQKY